MMHSRMRDKDFNWNTKKFNYEKLNERLKIKKKNLWTKFTQKIMKTANKKNWNNLEAESCRRQSKKKNCDFSQIFRVKKPNGANEI